jgi:drug/metabolite transporter (DMT)-like permease
MKTNASPVSIPSSSSVTRSYLAVFFSTCLLSLTGILIKFLLNDYHLESLALAFWRVLIVALGLGLALVVFRPAFLRIRRRDLWLLALFGFVAVGLHQLVWITSVQWNGVAVATVLVYIQPAIVAVVASRWFGESLDRIKIVALVLSFGGMILVARAYDPAVLNLNAGGIAIGFGTGITWASYALFARYHSRRYSPWTAMFYAFTFGMLLLLPLQFLVRDLFALDGSLSGWGILLFLALGPTLGGFGLYTVGLSQLPASIVTIIGTLEPVLSIVLAYFLFGETMNAFQIVGAGLILTSVLLLRPSTGAAGDV